MAVDAPQKFEHSVAHPLPMRHRMSTFCGAWNQIKYYGEKRKKNGERRKIGRAGAHLGLGGPS